MDTFNQSPEAARLLQIMESEHLTPTLFAKEIGVSNATISNIVNGRNKPSLEVMSRCANRYRMLSSDWLFLGIGGMYRPKSGVPEPVLFDVRPEEPEADLFTPAESQEPAPIRTKRAPQVQAAIPEVQMVEKKVTKVLVFFSDGTFQELAQ